MMNFFRRILNKANIISSRTSLIIKEFNLNRTYKYVWGMKKSGNKIRNKKTKLYNFVIVYLEDGFIHSFGTKKTKIPLSICTDKHGIYYDYKSKSELFDYIKQELSKKELLRSKNLISLWKDYGISKYNYSNFLEPPNEPFVLLIDQTYGDLSIMYGGADIDSFRRMYDFAVNKWPNLTILIKLHPDVISKKKRGYLREYLHSKKNIKVISEHGQINKLIESCTALCVVTSQVGFEGLIYGKEVHVFGNPFYSGWGLTIDHSLSIDRKKNNASLEQLVFSSLVKYQTYLDPRNKKICEIEKIIFYLFKVRKNNNFFPNNLYCLNLTPWKARQIKNFTKEIKDIRLYPFRKYNSGMKNVLVWGKEYNSNEQIAKTDHFIRVEDGFIRSVGLGGDLFSPVSLLFDKKGIHYDFSKPSDLEELLQNRFVNNEELKRAKNLIREIKIKKISKYNLKFERNLTLYKKFHKNKTILVLGQVETDNSIVYGVPNNSIKKTNYSLVCQVRKDFPNDYIIYKPHPDLEKGLRSRGLEENFIKNIADSIAYKIAIEELFEISDRVAVFTSLGGFEALLREIPVTCYGLPFYAGWGLTEDKFLNKCIAERRTRNLSLEALVFIALIKYPHYYSLKFNCNTEIEYIINEIALYGNDKKNIEQMIFRYWGALKDFLKKMGSK